MKSVQLVTLLAIASLATVACGSGDNASEDLGTVTAQSAADNSSVVDAAVNVSASLPTAPQETATSAGRVGAGAAPQASFSNHGQLKAAQQVSGNKRSTLKSSKSVIIPSEAGRDNPFALAEQPEFEVRFLPASTPAIEPLPPVPNIGLGPEPGASLLPLAPAEAELVPAVTTVAIPQLQPAAVPVPASLPEVSPNVPLPTVVPSAVVAPNVSPTALAEAVEIQGVVQLGDRVAVIVNDGEGTVSRTVQPGARLAGGQVELRRIETTALEPQVVLVQNGIEIVRGVGV